jgi:HK97 family phage prohead protease
MSKADKMERRAYSFEIRAGNADDGGAAIITGRPIVYESMTDLGYFSEIIKRGALDGANLKDVRFLVNHDMSRIPLARSRNNNENSTMQLMPDNDGLAIRVRLDTENNAEARALYSAVERGDISGMSFLFSVDSDEWTDLESEHPTRRITKIGKVVEISAVTFPAYDSTEISARSKKALDSARLELERAREQRAKSVDTDSIELAKAKYNYLFKNGG